jgi:undecaprenyl diphosphate synthase
MGFVSWLKGQGGRGHAAADAEAIPAERIPHHVGVIMDGNGRWASRRGLPVQAGHRAGTKALKRLIQAALRRGVRQLSVYTFSTENWSRPADEVDSLMDLVIEMIDSEVPELDEQGVRVVFIGRRAGLSDALRAKLQEAEDRTAGNERLVLFIAFNYGGRAEVIDAVRDLIAEGAPAESVDEEAVAARLYAPDMRPPDVVVRTSGELRLSNFLLWQSAYSELYFSPLLWPDFDEGEFDRMLVDFARRSRRFGRREEAADA